MFGKCAWHALRLQSWLHLETSTPNSATSTNPSGNVSARMATSAPPADFNRRFTSSHAPRVATEPTEASLGQIPR